MTSKPDCIGVFALLPTSQGGREGSVLSGYRPQHLLHDNYQTSALHQYEDTDELHPGQAATTKVWFITPEVYPRILWPGRVISVFEGSKRVGSLRVTEVLNPHLLGLPESFQPLWTGPKEDTR